MGLTVAVSTSFSQCYQNCKLLAKCLGNSHRMKRSQRCDYRMRGSGDVSSRPWLAQLWAQNAEKKYRNIGQKPLQATSIIVQYPRSCPPLLAPTCLLGLWFAAALQTQSRDVVWARNRWDICRCSCPPSPRPYLS